MSVLNARIKLKYDSLDTWNSSNFAPLSGEMCLAYVEDNGAIAVGAKVGDGTHTFSQLPWLQATAADVYAWAKAQNPPTASQIAATTTSGTSTVQAILTSIESALAGLNGAMHYYGTVQADPTVTAPTGTFTAGDVIVYGNKEYVYDGSTWRELGNEGSYALSTISISAGDGLTGGGNLTQNRTITHATPTGASATTLGTSGGHQYIQTLTTDKFGHVTAASYGTETTYHTVATSGSAYDLEEVNGTTTQYFIFDCGSASVLTDAAN